MADRTDPAMLGEIASFYLRAFRVTDWLVGARWATPADYDTLKIDRDDAASITPFDTLREATMIVDPSRTRKQLFNHDIPHEILHLLVRPAEHPIDRLITDAGASAYLDECFDLVIERILRFAVPLIRENERLKRRLTKAEGEHRGRKEDIVD